MPIAKIGANPPCFFIARKEGEADELEANQIILIWGVMWIQKTVANINFLLLAIYCFFTLVFVTVAVRICNIQGGIFNTEGPLLHNFVRSVQRWAQRWALGCRTFLPGPAWLMLSKTGPPFSPFLYKLEG